MQAFPDAFRKDFELAFSTLWWAGVGKVGKVGKVVVERAGWGEAGIEVLTTIGFFQRMYKNRMKKIRETHTKPITWTMLTPLPRQMTSQL
tara:strand:- start:6359 stop:6628 length:270 start_codon:yes stop_codon:yes gene_type:complete